MTDDRSLAVAGLDGSPPADWSADSGGCSVVLSADDLSPGDCWAPVDSAVPQACSAVTAPADSAALGVDDSALRDWPRPDVCLATVVCPDGSRAGWGVAW